MRTLGLCLLSLFCLFLKNTLDRTPSLQKGIKAPLDLQPIQAGYHGGSLKKYSFGFDNLMSASIWVQLLQRAEHTAIKSDRVSWEYAQVDAITELDPRFEQAYEFGAIFISTFRRDKLGGKLLLEKWIAKKPSYWRTHYMLGLHYLMQLKDKEKAGPYILKASQMSRAPEWLTSLGVRLISESGTFLQSLRVAVELWPMLQDPEAKYRLAMRMRSLNYNLQKKYWLEALEEYQKQKKKFPALLTELAPYLYHSNREIASTFSGEKIEDENIVQLLKEKFEFVLENKTITSKDPENEKLLGKFDSYDAPQGNQAQEGK